MSDLPPPPAPFTDGQTDSGKGMADLLYGNGSDNQFNYRLWRVERGNPQLRAGKFVTAAQAVGNQPLYSKANTTGLTSAQVDPSTSGFLKKGSTPKSVAAPNFSFVANSPTQLVISWTDYAIRRADNTATLLPAGRLQVDSLVANTLYDFHPFWSESAGAIGWVNGTSGGSGVPAVGFTTLNPLNVQQQRLAGNVDLGVISFTMPVAGSSSGTSGGVSGGAAGTGITGTGGGNRANLP